MSSDATTRALTPNDWPAVAAIYAEGIADGNATFEREVPEREAFFGKSEPLAALRLAAEQRGSVVGYCVATPTSSRWVYRGVAEVSIYVARRARGRGVGTLLLEALIAAAQQASVWTLQAGIFVENRGSIALFRRAGFRLLGRHERLGAHVDDHGAARWRDVLLFERRERDDEPTGDDARAVAGLSIRAARAGADDDGIWRVFEPIVRAADSYPYPPDIGRDAGLSLWLGKGDIHVAERDDEIVGSYYLAPNQPGLGDHVCNCGYIVLPSARGGGVGRAMCEHSLGRARQRGFCAMQFNLVVASNLGAVRLWRRLGFEIVGTLPRAFRHAELGLVDAHVMYRLL